MAMLASTSHINTGRLEYEPSLYYALEPSFRTNWTNVAVQSMHQESSHLSGVVGRASEESGLPEEPAGMPGLTWTFQQLHQGAVRMTAALNNAGLEKGSTIVTLLPNGADWCLIQFTCVVAKFNLASLDIGALQSTRTAELEAFLLQLKPAVIVIANNEGALAVDAAIKATGIDVPVKLTAHWDSDADIPRGWEQLDQYGAVVDAATEATMLEHARVDDHERTAITLFTSGTSIGRPKGCPRTVINLLHTLRATQRSNTEVASRRLVDSANFRAICAICSLAVWEDGGRMIVSGPVSTPESALTAIERYKVTDLVLVPAMIRIIEAHPFFDPSKTRSVRTVATGGDMITRAVLDLIRVTFPDAKGLNVHGMSEGGNLFYWPFFESDDIIYHGDIPTFGTVRKGVNIKVVDESGNTVPRGAPGELYIDSHITIRHYLDSVSPNSFHNDGEVRWLKTGDIAIIDEKGYVFILGRSKDIIKRAGVPITPGPLETSLSAYTQAEVVVIGIEHDILGAEPWAILSSFAGKTQTDLKQQVVNTMGKDYALGGAVTLQQLGFAAWPLNSTEKIHKVNLKAALLKYLASQTA